MEVFSMKDRGKTKDQFINESSEYRQQVTEVKSLRLERKQSEKKLRDTKEFLHNIIKSSLDGIITSDSEGYITRVNKAFLELLGYNEKEVVGKHVLEFSIRKSGMYKLTTGDSIEIDKKYFDDQKAMMSNLVEGREIRNRRNYFVRKDGKVVPCEQNISALCNKAGKVTGAVGIIRDISERKKAEEELKETKEHLNNLIESSLDCIVVSDKTGYVTKVNRYFLELFGYSEKEVVGKHVMECTPMISKGTYEDATREVLTIGKEFVDDASKMVSKLLKEGKVTNWETYYFRKDKKVVPIEQNIVCLYNKEGERTGAVAIIRDITQRKKAERELRETKDFLESIIENSKDGILVVDVKGYILSCNTSTEQMSGFSRKEMLGKHASILTIEDKEMRKKILEKTAELFEKGFTTYESQYKSKEGKCIDVECTSSMIKNEQGEYIAGVSIMRDISERKKAELEIREGKEFLEKIIKGSKDGIVICDEMGSIISINESMEQILGLSKEEIMGKHSSELLMDDKSERKKVLEKMGELFEKGFASYETRYKRKGGNCVDIECYTSMIKDDKGKFIAGVSIERDITEKKKMQQQLLQSEKLKSLGELAGGVAHDFNNVLAAILGRVQLLEMCLSSPPGIKEKRKSILDLKKGLEVIEKAALDGAETVRRIQEFSRRGTDEESFTQVEINELINGALEFTRARWKDEAESKGIKFIVKKDLSPLPPIAGSGAELREVFMNLINNALDALSDGGRITIRTFKENNHICVIVKDTGIGIPEAARERIFDPFFTTKGPQSTGLGLSVSYGIINRHRGAIAVNSAEGEGTTFTIKLPISEGIVKEEKSELTPLKQRKARILVVEDEEGVRNVLKDILTDAGHEVEIAYDGMQGIELFEKKGFDLVFTDLGMPVMSGWQVAEKVKSINKRVPVALITGWNVEFKESELKDSFVDLIIKKPFAVNRVLRLVQEGMELRDRYKAA